MKPHTTMVAREKLLQLLAKYPNVIIPQPTLTSVGFAPFDFSRGVLQDPKVLPLVVEAFQEVIDFSPFDLFAALPVSGISMTTALSLAVGKPFVVVRDDVKRPGRPRIMGGENFLKPGMKVLMVDDWFGSGLNKHNALKLLDEAGARVDTIACFGDFDMEEGDRPYLNELKARGIAMVSLVTWTELCNAQHEAGFMDDEFYELSLARLHPANFFDNSKGYLSRNVEYFRRHRITLVPEVREFLRKNGVDVSGL